MSVRNAGVNAGGSGGGRGGPPNSSSVSSRSDLALAAGYVIVSWAGR